MIANCKGCKEELEMVEEYSKKGLNFAGSGLYEQGHLLMRMVDDNGRIIVE
jgi:hypothetical protein